MDKKLFNYEIAAIAEALYSELEIIEASRSAWAFSIYYALMKCYGHDIPMPKWKDKYKQWNIDHLYRGSLSSKSKQKLIPGCNIINCKKNKKAVLIKGEINGSRDFGFEVSIEKKYFNGLYTPVVNETHLFILESEVDEILNALGEITITENTGSQSCKITALWQLVNEIRKVYDDTGKDEKDFIETVIGAAIFYLPHPVNECFNGYSSISALNNALKEKRIVKEHLFPRKRAGKDVLEKVYTKEEFYSKVKNEYRIFMYLTSEENKLTINYEGTHNEELKRLHIQKFPKNGNSPFDKNHTLYKNFICWAKPKISKNKDVTIDEVEQLLSEFIQSRNK